MYYYMDYSFDEMLDYAATGTTKLSGTELLKTYKDLFSRYDDIVIRKKTALFLYELLKDLKFYKKLPDTQWTEKNIFLHLHKFDI